MADDQAFQGTCPLCGQAYLASRVRELEQQLARHKGAIQDWGAKADKLQAEVKALTEQNHQLVARIDELKAADGIIVKRVVRLRCSHHLEASGVRCPNCEED